ncbi:MAG: DUF3703 domain-containing protein [Bacteriovoracaceae bacterium]
MNNLKSQAIIKIRSLVADSKVFFPQKLYDERLLLLEDAHLISQPYAVLHLYAHWEMFKFALKWRQWDEVFGQVPRLILAMPGSWLGRAPKGNVGSTKMGIFEEKQ